MSCTAYTLCTAVVPSTDQPDGTTKTGLLTIAAELRNRIYTVALVQDTTILITTGNTTNRHQPPALLGVNKQIRHEASGIYYTQNAFDIQILNFDISHLALLSQQRRGFHFKDPATVKIDDPEESWRNVMRWAKAKREKRLMFQVTTDEQGVRHAYLDAVNLVLESEKTMRGRKWEKVVKKLEWARISPEGRSVGCSRMGHGRV